MGRVSHGVVQATAWYAPWPSLADIDRTCADRASAATAWHRYYPTSRLPSKPVFSVERVTRGNSSQYGQPNRNPVSRKPQAPEQPPYLHDGHPYHAGNSIHHDQPDHNPILEPQLHEQTTRLQDDHTYHTNTHNQSTAYLINEYRHSSSTVDETPVAPTPESHEEKSDGGDLPRLKVLLYGNNRDYFSASDLKRFKKTCLKYIDGVHPDNIRVHSGPGGIGDEFHWFFDPNGIAPGGLLILCISGHGIRTMHGIDIRIDRMGQKLMDTLDLHTTINKIQVPCTLEIVLASCSSEAVMPELDRLLVMQIVEALENPRNTKPPPGALLKSLFSSSTVPKLDTKVTIIVWAAAVDGGPAYEEADLPNRKGRNDIMIGAICRTLASNKGAISRRALFEKIRRAVAKYNTARDKAYFSKTEAEQYDARAAGKYRGPQLACLLSSPGNPELILDSPAFVALNKVDVFGTPTAGFGVNGGSY